MILLRSIAIFLIAVSSCFALSPGHLGTANDGTAVAGNLCVLDNTAGSTSNTTYGIRTGGYMYGQEFECSGAQRTFAVGGDGADTDNFFKLVRVDEGGGTFPLRWDSNQTWVVSDGTNASYTIKYHLTVTSTTAATLKIYVGEVLGTPGTATVRISETDTYDLTSGYCEDSQAISGTGEYTFTFTGCDFED